MDKHMLLDTTGMISALSIFGIPYMLSEVATIKGTGLLEHIGIFGIPCIGSHTQKHRHMRTGVAV